MEELTVGRVVLLEYLGAFLQLWTRKDKIVNNKVITYIIFGADNIFERALPHVGLETIDNILLRVALEVHEDRAVKVDHRRGCSSAFVNLLESPDRLLMLVRRDHLRLRHRTQSETSNTQTMPTMLLSGH